MKKLLLLVLLVLLTGCAGGNSADKLLQNVTMKLEFQDNSIQWTILNEGKYTLYHGNGAFASLQVQVEDGWSNVSEEPFVSSTEGQVLEKGMEFSAALSLDQYGDLSDGTYRVVFPFHAEVKDTDKAGFASCSFQIVDGIPQEL